MVDLPNPAEEATVELEPCPFCGSPAKLEPIRDGMQVQCSGHRCFARGPAVFHGPGGWGACERDAVAAWNRRPTPSPTPAEADGVVETKSALALAGETLMKLDATNAEMTARALNAEDQLAEAVEALTTACDLLAERIHGNAARSPGHNARVILESALTRLTGQGEGG